MAGKYTVTNDKMDQMISESSLFKGDVSLIELMKVNHELNQDVQAMIAGGFIKKVTEKDGEKEVVWVTWHD